MTGTIFDIIEDPIPDGQDGFMELASRENKDPGFLEIYFSELGRTAPVQIGKEALKGTVEGLSQFGRMMGPMPGPTISQEEQAELLDVAIPTEDQFVPKSIRRGLKQAPSVLAFPSTSIANMLPKSILAGFSGQGAEDLGLPEWAQTAAELTAFIGPDITKKLIETGKNKDLIKAAKELGISDEALTPLLQSDFKQRWLSKLAPRRGRTQEVLSKSKEELQTAYGRVQQSEAATKPLADELATKFKEDIDQKMFNIPSEVRNKIKEDYADLLSKPITGESLINFYVDVGQQFGKTSKQLQTLKDPIKGALKEIDPKLADSFDTINNLYSRYYKIAKKLEPNLKTDIYGASEQLALLFSLATGNAVHLSSIVGETLFRRLAREMLLNPKLQQLGSKTVDAMNKGKFATVKKLSEAIAYQLKDVDNELSSQLEQISEEELQEIFKNP